MPQVTARAVGVLGTLFPKVGLPSNACANLCGARWRGTAGRFLPAAVPLRPAALRICDFGVFSVCTATLWWRARMRTCSFFGTSNHLAVSKAASKSARACARVVFSAPPMFCRVRCSRSNRARTRGLFGFFLVYCLLQCALAVS